MSSTDAYIQQCGLLNNHNLTMASITSLCHTCWVLAGDVQCLPCYNLTTAGVPGLFNFYCSYDQVADRIDPAGSCNLACPSMPPKATPAPTPYTYRGYQCSLYSVYAPSCVSFNGGADCQYCEGELAYGAQGQLLPGTCKPRNATCTYSPGQGPKSPATPIPTMTFQGLTGSPISGGFSGYTAAGAPGAAPLSPFLIALFVTVCLCGMPTILASSATALLCVYQILDAGLGDGRGGGRAQHEQINDGFARYFTRKR